MFFHLSTYDISRSSLSLLFSYLFPFCYASFHSLREAKRRGAERTEWTRWRGERWVTDESEWRERASSHRSPRLSRHSPLLTSSRRDRARAAQTRWTRKWRKEPTRNRDWEKRAEHNQIRTFILPSWLLPLWPNRLTPRDRGVRWVKGTEHRWNDGAKRLGPRVILSQPFTALSSRPSPFIHSGRRPGRGE